MHESSRGASASGAAGGRSSSPAFSPTIARLANVSAALLLGDRESQRDADGVRGAVVIAMARTLAESFEDVMLVGGSPPDDAPGRRIADASGPASALRGLVAALECAREERVLILSCELALVRGELLYALTAWPERDVVAPRIDGRPQPLCAIHRREAVLPRARDRLAAGALGLLPLLDTLDCDFIEGDDLTTLDPDADAFDRVTTPEDLDRVAQRRRY